MIVRLETRPPMCARGMSVDARPLRTRELVLFERLVAWLQRLVVT